MHPEVELTTSGIYPDFDATYRGHRGAVDYWEAARAERLSNKRALTAPREVG
jgi:hypothetical protein